MKFTLERVSEPAIEPISKDELKLHLRLEATGTTEDARLDTLIAASRAWVESYTSRVMVDSTFRLTFGPEFGYRQITSRRNGYCCGEWSWINGSDILLRRSPVIALTSFVTVDSEGATTTVSASEYALRESQSKWPRLAALSGATWIPWLGGEWRILFRAGFADRTGSPTQDATAVPAKFKQAILLYAEALYDRGDDMDKLIETAECLLAAERADLGLA